MGAQVAFGMLLAVLAACSGNGAEEGTGGTGATGGAGGGSGAGGSGASSSSDAGCVDFAGCAACLTSSCAVELAACDAVPGCLQAELDRASCLKACVSGTSCWNVLEISGGSPAEALRDCAKIACSVCQP